MPREKKKEKAKKAKTGNCWNERHHTCNGWGRKRSGEGGTITIYICSCPCHTDKERERAIVRAKQWEGAMTGLKR